MKRKVKHVLAVLMIILTAVCFVACDAATPDTDNNDGESTVCEHTYGEWVTKTAATCTASKVEIRECSKCGEVEERSVGDPSGHTYSEWETKTKAACNADRTEIRKCTACGITDERTVSGTATGEHNYSEWATKTAATCTEDEVQARTCGVCGREEYYTVPNSAVGHKFGVWSQKTAASCSADRTDKRTCKTCGYEETRQIAGTQTAHIYKDGSCKYCGKEKPEFETTYLGSYPQKEVEDTALKSKLNALAGAVPTEANSQAWTSYKYYKNKVVTDYMWYIDKELDGEKYRGVYFISYRPIFCELGDESTNRIQYVNGYYVNTVYWFKYEPIKWKILKKENGKAFVLADLAIDSQQFDYNNGNYSNNYAKSSIRKWLNEAFYNTAFSVSEKASIETTLVDNGLSGTGHEVNDFVCENTNDKVFLLNYAEATECFEMDVDRIMSRTDYARCQGAKGGSYAPDPCWWWLRTPHNNTTVICARTIGRDGEDNNAHLTLETSIGVVPAMWINLA